MQLSSFITYWMVRARDHVRRMGVAYLIFMVSLLPAAIVYFRAEYNFEMRDEARLAEVADRAREKIERHFEEVDAVLRGIRGLFLAGGTVVPEEWNLFLQSLQSPELTTGFRDFGFAMRVAHGGLAEHTNLVRTIRTNYLVYPFGEREEYFPIIYLRDVDAGDVNGLGWDPFANAERRAAMEVARDSGEAASTKGVAMAMPEGEMMSMRGHVVYLPVYRGAVNPETIEERREKLVGFVFASFLPEQLWRALLKPHLGNDVDFEVFEGGVAAAPTYATRAVKISAAAKEELEWKQVALSVFGRRWTLVGTATPAFGDPLLGYARAGILFAALAISLTVFSLARSQARGRAAAEAMNLSLRRSEHALRESETRFRRLTENARDVIYRYRLEPTPGFEYVSPAVEKFSGHPPEDFYKDPELLTRLTHPEDRGDVEFKAPYDRLFGGPVTLRFVNDDGSILWLEARNVPVTTEDGRVVGFEGVARDITEAKSSEAAIRRSEERLARIVETIADGVLILDPNGKVTYANAAAEGLLVGEGQAGFVERLKKNPTEVDPGIGSLVQLLSFTGQRHSFNYTYRRKDGTTMFLAVNAARFSIVDGQPAGVVASIRDVTAEKRGEQNLLQSQTRLRILNNILSLMAAGADVMQIAVRTVGELSRHFPNYRIGFSVSEGEGVWKVVCCEGTAALPATKNQTYRLPAAMEEPAARGQQVLVADLAGELSEAEYFKGVRSLIQQPVRHKGRIAAQLSFHSATPHEWAPTETLMLVEVADYLAAAYSQFDVAESRRAAEAALLAEKERLAVTLRSIADGVITTDTDGRIALMNHAAEALTGWTQTEAEGRPITDVLNIMDEKSRLPIPNPAQRVLNGMTDSEVSPGVVLQSKDGLERIVSESAAQILDHRSQLIGAVLVLRDITEKRRLEAELLKASKLESVGLLAGGIAHDFNNILSVILGNVTLSKMLSAPMPKVQDRLALAEKSCLRARELTQQLLTFAKGGAPIRKAASVLDIVRDSTEFAVTGSNVVSKTHAPADLWAVEVDEGQISQVFNNLVINAVHAMPEGGTLRIAMENLEGPPNDARVKLAAGRYVRISVQDSGSGIAPEHLPRIFDPYFTTKKSGTGLGLATTYAIIQKHQGAITVESLVGVGTTFHVYLPASDQPVVAKAPEQEVAPAHGGRILLMDDEPEILDMASASLKHLGYEMDTALNGTEAIKKFMDARRVGKPFDAVIMDLTIPGGMGGKEAMKRLQEIDPQVRAIVSSGYSQDPVMANFRDYGFSGVVEKPYQVGTLAQTLAQILPRTSN